MVVAFGALSLVGLGNQQDVIRARRVEVHDSTGQNFPLSPTQSSEEPRKALIWQSRVPMISAGTPEPLRRAGS